MSFASSILRLGGGVVALLGTLPAGVPASGAPGPSVRTIPMLISGDLRPHIVAGLNEAWRQGYLGASKAQSDYGLGSAVLGWEITGLNDAAMAVKGLSCVAQARR